GGEWRGTTGGHCPAYQQVNLAIIPRDVAAEFAAARGTPSLARSSRSPRRASRSPFARPLGPTSAPTCRVIASTEKDHTRARANVRHGPAARGLDRTERRRRHPPPGRRFVGRGDRQEHVLSARLGAEHQGKGPAP